MKKTIVIIVVAVLFILLVLLLVGGPLLNAMGVEVFCINNEDGLSIVRCGGEPELTADSNPPQLSADARPVLIDTDMAADDWMAILYLLQRTDIDVRAITVTGAGESHCEPGIKNALDLANFAGRPEIPVTCGRETPLEGEHVFPQSWRDNVDELAGISIPINTTPPHEAGAAELISSTIRETGGELEIIALGPLTNLADAFLEDPALAGDLKQLYIMGGAFSVPGNVTDAPEMDIDNEFAEWNIYIDPQAAATVVESGAPITFVPLDASNMVRLDEAFFDRLAGDRNTPEAEFVFQLLDENIGFVRSGDYYFWDPLTAAILVDESLGTFESQPMIVIVAEGAESGATLFDDNGNEVRVTTAAAGERFKQHFLDVLNGRVDP